MAPWSIALLTVLCSIALVSCEAAGLRAREHALAQRGSSVDKQIAELQEQQNQLLLRLLRESGVSPAKLQTDITIANTLSKEQSLALEDAAAHLPSDYRAKSTVEATFSDLKGSATEDERKILGGVSPSQARAFIELAEFTVWAREWAAKNGWTELNQRLTKLQAERDDISSAKATIERQIPTAEANDQQATANLQNTLLEQQLINSINRPRINYNYNY